MDITRYAHERWQYGARSEEDVAVAFARLALGQKDRDQALQMLLPALRAAVSVAFRAERMKIEDRVPWDNLLPSRSAGTNEGATHPATGTTGRTTNDHTRTNAHPNRTYLGTSHAPSTLDAINALLKTHIWVWRIKENGHPDGQMIPWSELTLDDIGPTIARERDVIAGHERRIARLQKARDTMIEHGVTRFGDVPWSTRIDELVAF
jgi:hypothetical protein